MEFYLEGEVPVLSTRQLFANSLSSTLPMDESPMDSGIRTLNGLVAKLEAAEKRGDSISISTLTKAITDAARRRYRGCGAGG